MRRLAALIILALTIAWLGPLAVTFNRGAPDRFYHSDAQGSRLAFSNSAGVVGARERYAPFGESLLNGAGMGNFITYTGHMRDVDTGLTYMQARLYDPVIGRFLSTDPIGYQDQLNLYAYVANDPVNKVDPTGEQSENIMDQRNAALASFAKDNPAVAVTAAVVLGGGAMGAVFAPEIGAAVLANAPALTEATSFAAEAVAPGAGAGALAGTPGAKTAVEFVTKGKSIPNIKAGMTKGDFEKNLSKSGFEKSVSKDGKANNFTNGDKTISTRDTARSTDGPSADVRVNDQSVSKIRLEEDLNK